MIAYALITIVWAYLGWYSQTYSEHATAMQRGLIAIPLMKFLQVSAYGSYVATCPWPD